MPKAIAFAPATVANIGVGFDIMGLALHEPGDTVIAELRAEPGVVIERIEGDGGKLTLDPTGNTMSVAAQSVLNLIAAEKGVSLVLKKDLPLSSGLGSSAASAVAGAVAVNALFGEPLSREALLAPALDGEAVASGYHPDNVGPSLFGGITLFTSPSADALTRMPVPDNLYLALVTPGVEVPTAEARALLPENVPLKTLIRQTASVAKLVDALHRGDMCALGEAVEADHVIEPARASLMPYLREVRSAAKQTGAFGLFISGAGPTLCAVCDNAQTAAAVAAAMASVYTQVGVRSVPRHGQVSVGGARILEVQHNA